MRVLVCGGRDFDDLPLFDRVLDALHEQHGVSCLIHGDANGADAMAHLWAGNCGVTIGVYHARWAEHGRKAGPIRNQRMLTEGKPDLVVAFPRASGKIGRGTADMVRRARAAGVKVIEVGGEK